MKKIFIMSRSFSEDGDLERSDFAVLLCRHVNTRSVDFDCPSQSFNAIGFFGCFHFSAMTCLFCFTKFAIFFWPIFTLKGYREPNKLKLSKILKLNNKKKLLKLNLHADRVGLKRLKIESSKSYRVM